MKKYLVPLTASAVVAGVLATGGLATAATASPITVHQGDLIKQLSDTRATGHVTFLKDGVHVWTSDAANPTSGQNKAAEYFAVSGGLPSSGSLEWIGTTPAPGAQIVFDADGITGNGNDYNILVGESVYGDNWWLTNGSSATAKAVDPSGAEDGGNGSAYFGSLAAWKQALPEARVYAAGFSLGSGVKGDGVIRSITLGATIYGFTNVSAPVTPVAPAPVVKAVTAKATVLRKTSTHLRVLLASDALPAGVVQGKKVVWKIAVDGKPAGRIVQGAHERDVFRAAFPRRTGKHVVTFTKNDALVRTVTVRTGR